MSSGIILGDAYIYFVLFFEYLNFFVLAKNINNDELENFDF
jgi:hypothetical protein